MPQSDLDEFTGRTVDGVARDARFLDTIEAIKEAIRSGDRDRELAGFERAQQLWSEMTGKEREGAARMMGATISLVSGQKALAETWADATIVRLHDLHSSRAQASKTPETQASISAWAEATFGPSGSNARAIARANREMAELLEHVTADDRHPEAAEEIADIVIVLSRVMTRLGVDLQAEVDRKMAKNRARKWRLDGTGHGYHVKEVIQERPREYCATCGHEVP